MYTSLRNLSPFFVPKVKSVYHFFSLKSIQPGQASEYFNKLDNLNLTHFFYFRIA